MKDAIHRVRRTAAEFAQGTNVRLGPTKVLAELGSAIRAENLGPGSDVPSAENLTCDLLFGAVNYCYWSGRANFQPAGGGASLMRNAVFSAYKQSSGALKDRVEAVVAKVAAEGFPLSDRRVYHLREIGGLHEGELLGFITRVQRGRDVRDRLEELLAMLPGYAGDVFLKRALLFFHLCHRVYGLFPIDEIGMLPAPIDYQVPKMLRARGALVYSDALAKCVDAGEIIPSGSRYEMEIRAAALSACAAIAAEGNVTESEVDCYLWCDRKSVAAPYHLTITTDY